MIHIVTPAEKNGGILQFSIKFAEVMQQIQNCILWVPDTVEDKYLNCLADNYKKYKKVKTISKNNRDVVAFGNSLAKDCPEKVLFMEDSVLMHQLSCLLRKKGIPTSIVVHDTVRHPSHKMTLRQNVVEVLRQRWMKKSIKIANNIILLSNHSKNEFDNMYKNCKAKTVVMRLGAHVPEVSSDKPQEIFDESMRFLLFFGRVDKYKGIEDLCRAYTNLSVECQNKIKLVIAGKGDFSEIEKDLIENNNQIIVLNRFIKDEEMLWLIEHSEIVVLPYIEATQSGVLPIAYHYKRPVIVRNLPGLVENVEEGKTAVVFENVNQLTKALESVANKEYQFSMADIFNYYCENYDWQQNLSKLMEQI